MNKKILMVVANQGFRDEEYLYPREVFENNGVEIKTASLNGGQALGISGTKVNTDFKVEDININDFDGVLFVGGAGIVSLVNDPALIKLSQDFYANEKKLVTAICAAPAILANAGLLEGKKATSTPSMIGVIKENGAIYNNNKIEIDGRIITADGPASAKEFGEVIASVLK